MENLIEQQPIEWLQAVILAAIQGLTEFLPISSSGHLVLPQVLLGWSEQGLAFDVAVHVGSLLAVIFYFRSDIHRLLVSWYASCVQGRHSDDSKLAWLLILATLPAVIAGYLLNDVVEMYMRNGWVLAATTFIFGIVLWLADRVSSSDRSLQDIGISAALFIGTMQALALVPGTSRSGITITAALLIGLGRAEAARFSFLMSMPIIAAAGLYKLIEVLQQQGRVDWDIVLTAVGVSGATAYLCIHLFMRWINRIGMLPFAIYRVLLACIIAAVMLAS